MIHRLLDLPKKQSFFLFGVRGCGKTTLLQKTFSKKDSLFIDLLDSETFNDFLLDPSRFVSLINSEKNKKKRVIIDEIQRIPPLLNDIHSEIQKTKRQFILTGSSSRKLKQTGVNLLAGRAWIYNLYPFTSFELDKKFSLKKVLEWGSLPESILQKSSSSKEYLNAYVGTYLEKEIQQEKWVKNLKPFRHFLSIAAQMNGQIINKSKIARDVGVDDVTVANYFEILEDTLLGIFLPAYNRSVRRSQRQASKFYFIDTGIARALSKTLSIKMSPQTSSYGNAFEHWFILEIIKLASYKRKDWEFSYLRTREGLEIDLIIKKPKSLLLIEIKSKSRVKLEDAKVLETLGKDIDSKTEKWLISNDPLEQKLGSTKALHWQQALKKLFF